MDPNNTALDTPDTDQGGTEELSLRDELERQFEAEPTDEVKAEKPENVEDPGGRQRDEHGRFTSGPGVPAKAPTAPVQGQPPTGTPAPPPADIKPPATWTPQAREEWASLSPRIKQEIARREWEANRVVQEGAAARQFQQAFERVVGPYEMFIRQEQSNPLQAVQNMMQTAAELRIGSPESKANLVAGLVKNFGIDVRMLDTALDKLLNGNGPGLQNPQQFRDPRVDQLLQQQAMQAQQADQYETQQLRSVLDQFAETHEFYRDVADVMADIVDMKTRRGEYVDLEKVYAQACKMNDDVATIVAQRQTAASRQQTNSQAVLRARRAAVSVKGESTSEGAMVPKDDSIRAALEAAYESQGRV